MSLPTGVMGGRIHGSDWMWARGDDLVERVIAKNICDLLQRYGYLSREVFAMGVGWAFKPPFYRTTWSASDQHFADRVLWASIIESGGRSLIAVDSSTRIVKRHIHRAGLWFSAGWADDVAKAFEAGVHSVQLETDGKLTYHNSVGAIFKDYPPLPALGGLH